jgi:beta-lactamase superfamily II metal-dependent hydrolase
LVTFEALNALYGDCLLLRYPGPDGKERLWIIDGGPRSETVNKKPLWVWRDVLLPHLEKIGGKGKTLPVALGMVSHIDDDHINGIQQLTNLLRNQRRGQTPPVQFSRFWFNSFDDLVGPMPSGPSGQATTAATDTVVNELSAVLADEHATLVMQSVRQGVSLASDLGALGLKNNFPVNGLVMASKAQPKIPVEGAVVTVIGPMKDRVEKLRKKWIKALQKPAAAARKTALQDLFLPNKSLDQAVPNLSSIVVLVDVGGRKLLLTGDANGKYIVSAWQELGLKAGPVKIDLLKMPHHGSIRNSTEDFLKFFIADHYVFSANGKYDNPDAPTIEALVKMHGKRKIVLHFTNEDVTWKDPYQLEKNKTKVRNLKELLSSLHAAYPGPWTENLRKPADKSVVVNLG